MSAPSPHAPRSTPTQTRTIAVVGNPNTGKTTLFNALTGLSQRVGNYAGVTVERKSGRTSLPDGSEAELLDLPGAYSLAASSPDEMIAVDVLLGQRSDTSAVSAVLAIIDATNLRRNLYLVSQVIEVGLPTVVALNMTDIARSRKIDIDAIELSQRLGVAVVPICASRREGLDSLRQALLASLQIDRVSYPSLPTFPRALREQVDALIRLSAEDTEEKLSKVEALRALIDVGGHAEMRLLEHLGPERPRALEAIRNAIGFRVPLASVETDSRYLWIDGILDGCAREPEVTPIRPSDRIDRVLTDRLFGLLGFLAVSAVIFQGIYEWSAPLMEAIDASVSRIGVILGGALPDGALRSLLVDGIVAGVGGVLVFLPQIAILFLFIALLEDCGYMARAAFLMDRLLSRCGLSGQSFIPLLSSFACAIPGIMAARTIGDRRDRIATIAVAPLMSCSARLPVYVLFIGAFIPDRQLLGGWIGLQGLTLLAMYLVGVVVAIPIAWILKKTALAGGTPALLLELPSYKWPDPGTVALRVYHSARAFVVRAGTIIFAATVVIWALAYFPRSAAVIDSHERERQALVELVNDKRASVAALGELESRKAARLLETSYLGQLGHFIEPAVRPLGWDWRIGMATIASFPAREVIISVLGTIYSLGGEQDEESGDLRDALTASTWPDGRPLITIPVALSVMVFFALCAQCASTLAVIQRESSWKWAAFTFAYMTALAYVGAYVTYRVADGVIG